MTRRCAAFCAALFVLLTGSAQAQDVTLRSPDGAVEISGTLLGFDGEFYRVDTQFGELTVDGSGVLCDGPGCPNLSEFVAEVVFSGASSMTEVLMPALVEGFARRQQLSIERIDHDAGHFTYELTREGADRPSARFEFRVTTTDEGFADLLANEADIVLASREIRAEERQRAEEAGMGDLTETNRSRVLALDAMVPVVAHANPVRDISTATLARIFAAPTRRSRCICRMRARGSASRPRTVWSPRCAFRWPRASPATDAAPRWPKLWPTIPSGWALPGWPRLPRRAR